jgi:chromosomal replication initiator protein
MNAAPSTAAEVWHVTLGQLQVGMMPAHFDTWLRDTVGLRHDDERLIVGAPTDFATEWLSIHLKPHITRALAVVLGRPADVGFEVIPGDDAPPPLQPLAGDDDAPRRQSVVRPALNAALNFDSFVVGPENRLAFEAARAAARGCAANPVVVFGASGLGKTHLLTAAAHAAADAGRAVVMVTGERFGNDIGRASVARDFETLRSRYRACDVLIVDDVQFFEGKSGFQEQFLHAFNDLHARGATIIVSCDRPPSQLTGISDALRSRLQWGLVADLQKPGADTRLAILRAKARRLAAHVPDEALAAIASKCCRTVRELEGYLHRVVAYGQSTGAALTPGIIEQALNVLTPNATPGELSPPAADAVLQAVCRHTGAVLADLNGRGRSRGVSYARHLAMFLLKEDARKSVAEIGRLLGNRNHATVLAALRKIEVEQRTRAETSADIAAIRGALGPTPDPPRAATAIAS